MLRHLVSPQSARAAWFRQPRLRDWVQEEHGIYWSSGILSQDLEITFDFIDLYSKFGVYNKELMFLSQLTDVYGAGVKKALKLGKGILFVIFNQEFAIHRPFL